ncbi:hypothetical protein Holit_00755 [Hollandina sp. SP2]
MNNHCFKVRFLGILTVLAVLAAFSVAAMFLWNLIMPDIFGLPKINYWQAAGFLLLCRILFGNFGPAYLPYYGHGRRERLFHQSNPLREKWMNMSEEERKAFIEKEKDFRHIFHDHFSRRFDYFNEKDKKSEQEGNHE